MIEVNHLTKKYGNHTAVSDLSFSIEEGQIYGFLGPNGAGKSTTMNIMAGCLAATAGKVTIDGYDIFEDAAKAKKQIGYLPEQPPLYLDRTPREYLNFVAEAKGFRGEKKEEQITRVMEETKITDVADRLIKNLSKGYKQRVGIAQAILGDPKVIILDEPTVGLDPRQIIEIRELIQNLGKAHTVILSSHILSEVQAVCQTILIISKGKLVACDTPENLEKLFAGSSTVELLAEGTPEEIEGVLERMHGLKNLQVQPEEGSRCRIQLEADDEDEVCRRLFFAFADARKPILRMSTSRVSLEDIFIELTDGDAQAVTGTPDAGKEAASEAAETEETAESIAEDIMENEIDGEAPVQETEDAVPDGETADEEQEVS